MEALDWGMAQGSSRLVDWRTASQIGARLAGAGPPLTGVDRARLEDDFARLVPEAESLVSQFTGLTPQGYRARAWVMSRSEWIDANLRGFHQVLEPLAERVLSRKGSVTGGNVRRKGLGMQVGMLMGYVARKVLGQYDLFLPPDDDGLLYFVGGNVVGIERRFKFPREDFRMWLALHEVSHRVQFGSVPWLREFLMGRVDEYLSSVELDAKRVLEALKRAVEELRTRKRASSQDLIFLLMTPEQRAIIERVQALMSLLEGHANYVMDRVGEGRVREAARMRRGLQERRKSSGVERTFQRVIGFESKIRQYDVGERFVARVVDVAGMDGFNRVWESAENLPVMAEVMEPDRWLARVTPEAGETK